MQPDTIQPSAPQPSHTLRNGIFCCLIFLACLGLVWPVTQMGFIDDWSYFRTAQLFAQTGHIVYNGWADPMEGWMIPWGALFIKLFGASYMAVRLSMLPIALLTILLFHSILIRFGITPRNAIIGTLTLGLSPIFLPFAAIFMTDLPCLFVVVICLYCCQRAATTHSTRMAILWLFLAAASNVAGGTVRQLAWLGALVMLPATGWLLRKRRPVFFASLALWLASIGAIFYCMHWFSQQPYAVQTHILPAIPSSALLGIYKTIISLNMMAALLLCSLLVVFPVLAPWLPQFGKKFDHYVVLFCMGLLPLLMLKYLSGNLGIIWPASTLDLELTTAKNVGLDTSSLVHQSLIPVPARIIISVILITAVLGCAIALRKIGWKTVRSADPSGSQRVIWLLVPFCVGYLALLLLAIWQGLVLSKYALDFMPFAIAGSIWLYQQCVRAELPKASIALLIIYTIVGVAGTHTWFARHRARLAAIREVLATGVPRTQIQAGFEYDGETQILTAGHINNPSMVAAPGVYKPSRHKFYSKNPCDYNFLPLAPALHPKYAVGFGPKKCFLPSKFPPIHYIAWIPPFHRVVHIVKVPQTKPHANSGQ